MRRLRSAGFLLLVVTNQPEVARGTLTMNAVEAVNDELAAQLPIDAVYVCPHTSDACDCRKPKPGMILDAAEDWDVDLAASWINRKMLEVEMHAKRVSEGTVERIERCEHIIALFD